MAVPAEFVLYADRRDALAALEDFRDQVWSALPDPRPTVRLVHGAPDGPVFDDQADADANFVALSRRLWGMRADVRVVIEVRLGGRPRRLLTNRDFYDFVWALPKSDRKLETYLRALAALTKPHRSEPGLALDVFADCLREALTSEAAAAGPADPNAFEALLWQQIAELPRLKFARRHWDYAAVRGSDSRWYNASVDGFLERGAEGAWHGWGAEGEDLEYMPFLTWEELCSFLRSGQWYE
ncbi:hypothetical protein OJ998_19145 [Solirubrobacter taibaiensis]|nr:hypothetical protein [Solirubrobacter taibaiensis]